MPIIARIPAEQARALLDQQGVSSLDHSTEDREPEEVELWPGVVVCNEGEDEIVVAQIAIGDRPGFLIFPVESEDEVVAMAPGVEIGVAPIVAAIAKAAAAVIPMALDVRKKRRKRLGKGTVREEIQKRRAAKGKEGLLAEWKKRRAARRAGGDRIPLLDRFAIGRRDSIEAPLPPPGWAWAAVREEDIDEAVDEVLEGITDELGAVPWETVAQGAAKSAEVIATGAQAAGGRMREGGTALVAKGREAEVMDKARKRLASKEGQGRLRDAVAKIKARRKAKGKLKQDGRFKDLLSRREKLAARRARRNAKAGNTMLLPSLPEGFVWVLRPSVAPTVAGAELGCMPPTLPSRNADEVGAVLRLRGGGAPLPGPFQLRGGAEHLRRRGSGIFDASPEVSSLLIDTDGSRHRLSGPRG